MFELATIRTSTLERPTPSKRAKQLKTLPARIPPGRDRGPLPAARPRSRTLLWTAAGVVTAGFLVALECAARHYGVRGPITEQAREVVFSPARARCCTPVSP
ncbi:hypothetical protein STENM223S_02123 [Streptomyces tendae]